MAQKRNQKTDNWLHPHPATIITNSLKQSILLFIPIIRAFSAIPEGFQAWFSFVWVDFLTLGGMVTIGFLRYLTTAYRIEVQGLSFRSGILFQRHGYIPFDKVSVMLCVRQFYFRPLRLCKIYLDTDAGKTGDADFTISVSQKRAKELTTYFRQTGIKFNLAERESDAHWWEVVLLSLISSSSLSGILFVSAAISGLGDPFGEDIERIVRLNFERFVKLANLLAINIPPIAAWIAYLLLITWGISFMVHVLRTMRFTARRQNNDLILQSGLLSRYDSLLKVSCLNRVELRQSLMTKLLHIQSVFVRCSGYGKRDNDLSVLLPACTEKRMRAQLKLLLPEITFQKRRIQPRLLYLMRFFALPIQLLAGITALAFLLFWLIPDWHDTIAFIAIASGLPVLWFLVVKCAAYRHTGIAETADSFTLCYTFGYGFYQTAVPKNKITRVQIHQSLFQKINGGCDLLVYTRSEGWNRIRVPNLPAKEVKELFAPYLLTQSAPASPEKGEKKQ